jgi:RHS repeat-associated protein
VTYARGDLQEEWDYWYDADHRLVTREENAAARLTVDYARNLQLDVTNVLVRNTQSGETAESSRHYDGYHRLTGLALGYNAPATATWQVGYEGVSFAATNVVDPEGHRVEVAYVDQLPTRFRLFPTPTETNETLLAYTPQGLLAAVTNANGHWVRYGYDSGGYVTNIAAEIGPVIAVEHDVLGHVSKIALPGETGERVISLTNDEGGRVTAVTYPDGTGERFGYDAYGSLLTAVDTAGRTSRWTYVLGDLTSFSRTLAGTTDQEATIRLARNQQMNLIAVIDPLNRNVETYRLDPAGRVTNVVNVEGRTLALTYGVGNAVKSLKRFDDSRVDLDYTGEGNLGKVAWTPVAGSSQSGLTNRYAYLRNGLLVTASNEAGTISNVFDGANRLVSTVTGGPGAPRAAIDYDYFPAGNVSSVSSVAGTNTYRFDAAERLSSLTQVSGLLPRPLSFTWNYSSANGLVSSVACSNTGLTASYDHDVMDRWTNIVWRDSSSNVVAGFAYAYDSAGLITQEVLTVNSSLRTYNYSYDSLDRLIAVTSESFATSVVTYAYDLAGNRTQMVDNVATSVYTLGIGDRLVSWGINAENTVQYDVAGNVTNMGFGAGRTVRLTWNARYQLTAAATNGAPVERYGYDVLGRRAWTAAGATTNWHVYDGPHVVADLDATGGVLRSYSYGPGIDDILAMTVHASDGGTTSVSTVFYYVKDHLGTVHALVDETGSVVERYEYDAWGRVLGVFDGAGNALAATAIGNRYLWQGREYSWATGLYNFRARWYDPVTGRWLSNDPIGISGGLNQYVAFRNNPINFIDPFGLDGLDLAVIRAHIRGVESSADMLVHAMAAGESDMINFIQRWHEQTKVIGLAGQGAVDRESRPAYINEAIDKAERWRYVPGRAGMVMMGGFAGLGRLLTFQGLESASREVTTAYLLQEWGIHMMGLANLKELERQALLQQTHLYRKDTTCPPK